MQSQLSAALKLKYKPVAIVWSDQKPDNAMQFTEGKWGCIMWLAASAARGKAAVCDRKTFGCFGGGVGMGFGLQYKNFPGGEACFCHFLSSGNDQWETGRQAAEQVKPFMTRESHDNFVHGERYFKNPELVQKFIDSLPMTDIPSENVVFKPLSDADSSRDAIQTVVFFANPDQLSALVILANYGRGGQHECHHSLCRGLSDHRHLSLPGGPILKTPGRGRVDGHIGQALCSKTAWPQSVHLCHAVCPVSGDGCPCGRLVFAAAHLERPDRGLSPDCGSSWDFFH